MFIKFQIISTTKCVLLDGLGCFEEMSTPGLSKELVASSRVD